MGPRGARGEVWINFVQVPSTKSELRICAFLAPFLPPVIFCKHPRSQQRMFFQERRTPFLGSPFPLSISALQQELGFNVTFCLSNIALRTLCVCVNYSQMRSQRNHWQHCFFPVLLKIGEKQMHEKPNRGQSLSRRCAPEPHEHHPTPQNSHWCT